MGPTLGRQDEFLRSLPQAVATPKLHRQEAPEVNNVPGTSNSSLGSVTDEVRHDRNCSKRTFYIRRPWPSPRQGRRLGPPEVWNLLCHICYWGIQACRTCFVIALCYWGIQACRYQASNASNSYSYNPPNPSRHLPPPLQPSNCCMASSRQLPPSPLAVSLCCSRVAACPLPAHPSRQLPPSSWPSGFQHCSLPFACT